MEYGSGNGFVILHQGKIASFWRSRKNLSTKGRKRAMKNCFGPAAGSGRISLIREGVSLLADAAVCP